MPGARYVDRRLRSAGWLTLREVEVVHGRSHGWIDLLPDPRTGRLVVEIKTRLDDVGAIERQLGWYRRMAPAIARAQGWEVRQTTGWLAAGERRGGRSDLGKPGGPRTGLSDALDCTA